jgi:hypothetical protein
MSGSADPGHPSAQESIVALMNTEEIDRFLRTGDCDILFSGWPGQPGVGGRPLGDRKEG